MPTFKTPIIAILLGGLALTACQSGSGSGATAGKGEAAAIVNGTKISVAEVDRVTAEQAQGQQAQLSQLELASARLQVLESLPSRHWPMPVRMVRPSGNRGVISCSRKSSQSASLTGRPPG